MTRSKRARRRIWTVVGAGGIACIAAAVAFAVGTAASVAPGPGTAPADLHDGLGAIGERLDPASNADTAEATVGAESAAQIAIGQEAAGQPLAGYKVYLGRLTEESRLGPPDDPMPAPDPSVPPPSVNRLVYAVQITGINLYPSLNPEDSSAPVNHELVVFIDAMSGQEVLATSFR